MQCLLLSASSLQTCLHNSIFAMSSFLLSLNLLTKLAMFTWVPSHLMILFGLWSVRDFCYMLWVVSCHALLCYVMILQHVDILLQTLLLDVSSWHVVIFTKSVVLLYFALLPCLFEPAIVCFSRSSVFIFCQASWVDHYHVLCYYVGVQ